MSIDNRLTLGEHPTPEHRQNRKPRVRFVKLSRDALDALADRLDLPLASTRLLDRLAQELVEEWRYEPRIVPARSRRELWDLLRYNARCALPALLDAGLVAEHPGIGFEVLCWSEIVADSPRDYEQRRQRAEKDLAQDDRRAAEIEVLYAASLNYELPCSAAHERRESVHERRESVHERRESVHERRGRPAETTPIEPLELLEPPLPPDDPEVLDLDAEGGDSEQQPRTAQVLNLDAAQSRRSEKRWQTAAAAELARLEAKRDALGGTVIRSPEGYCRTIQKRLAADPEVLDNLARYRKQYPTADPAEIAALADSDRPAVNLQVSKQTRPSSEDQNADGWSERIKQSRYAEQLADLDAGLGGAQ